MRLACAAALVLATAYPAMATRSAAVIRDRIAVAWTDPESNLRVDVVPVSKAQVGEGNVLGPGDRAQVVSVDDLFLVVWVQKSSLVATRITFEGVVIDQFPLTVAGSAKGFAMASSGKDVLMVWTTETEVRRAIVTPFGAVTRDVEPMATLQYGGGVGPIAWDGKQYLLSWGRLLSPPLPRWFVLSETFLTFLDGRGELIGTLSRPPIGAESIAAGGGAFLILGHGGTPAATAYARVVSADQIDGPHVLDSRYLGPLHAIWTGTWFDVVLANEVLRIAADGTVIDHDRFFIPTGWIYAIVLTPRGLVAVSEIQVGKHPLLEIVVPWPKQRASRRR